MPATPPSNPGPPSSPHPSTGSPGANWMAQFAALKEALARSEDGNRLGLAELEKLKKENQKLREVLVVAPWEK